MPDRLIQIVVPTDRAADMRRLVQQHAQIDADGERNGDVEQIAVRVPAEEVEALLDPLESNFNHVPGFQAFVLSLEAVLPRPTVNKDDGVPEDETAKAKKSARIAREELYHDLKELTQPNRLFIVMVIVSTIIAAVGLSRSNATFVIGAMVLAPLLGPNMALALATTLGDEALAKVSLKTNLLGICIAAIVALVCGLLLDVDPQTTELASRTTVDFSDILIALAAGVAGALAFTSGVPASLVGVMVAVALLPPLVACVMLLVAGYPHAAGGTALLLCCNVISVNLAGVATFIVQGVSPRTWWDGERSKRMTRRAIAIWLTLLATAVALVWVSQVK